MEFRMITKKAQASSREIPPGKTIKEGRTETDSFRTRDPTMDCSPTCPKAQEISWQPRRHQIEEAVKLGRLAHLVKEVRKRKVNVLDTQLGEWKKGDKGTTPTKGLFLMISRRNNNPKRKLTEESTRRLGKIMFPLFQEMTTPLIQLSKRLRSPDDKRTLLASQRSPSGNSDKEGPFVRTKVLAFVIVRSNSLHYLILERTAMQKMAIVNHKETSQEATKDTLSCMNVEEEIVINDKYPDQTVIIGRQLPTSFKKRLRDLLKTNADIFAWTYSDMTGIPRTIMKRGLAPERSETLHKEVEELTKVNILREVKYQTWVSNPIMIKKGVENWKLCMDFTDINKACLKEPMAKR
ncbi:hypothetical protein Tco_1355143 [Tanacetum coccineum]